ncbi:LADA_0A03180g1_1 [Lachancea dasiensis]|uniref:SWR1-complex protein 5 n=1 Tax=Lachancea dasiensis TaxID=1072105 RepID=A0A1G4IMZ5_9SACH|nr:LADA_0A03180g1_1 [Lachancea dasiensis]
MSSEERFETSSKTEGPLLDEESYNEDEDEDFDPSKDLNSVNEQDEDSDDDNDNQGPDYSKIESVQGGLVRTRRGRELEDRNSRLNKYESLRESSISQETNSVWDELQKESGERIRKSTSVMDESLQRQGGEGLQEEQVLIDRKYEFAGEILHEKKWVPKSSAEAQEYLNSAKFKQKQKDSTAVTKDVDNAQGSKLRKPLKRPPILEQIIAGALKPKLTTLEKSKLDWATYVDKEGINEELNLHNKDGYLAKQDFLHQVESFKDEKYRQMRKSELQQRLAGT